MANPLHAVASALVDRTALALFGFLTAAWFLPALFPPLGGTPLVIPPYIVVMVAYDGLFGLEHVAYAATESLPIAGGVAFDAGLVVTFYLFAVLAVALGGVLKRRLGPASADDSDARTLGRFGYAIAAGLLVVGLLLAAQGGVAQPTVTSETCTQEGTAEAAGNESTPTTTCTTRTEPATGQQRYVVGLGVGIASLGAGIVGTDRWLAEA
jgi:hypothetical protein